MMTAGGKDVTVTTDDFVLEQVERSQRDQTRRRRDNRFRRRQIYTFGGIGLLALVALGAPSLISHSSVGRSILIQSLANYGLDSDVESLRIGWVTPLRVTGLEVAGASGSTMRVDQLDVDATAGDLLWGARESLGQIVVRGVEVACSVTDGRCSLEDDLEPLLHSSNDGQSTSCWLKIQDVTVSVSDAVDNRIWHVTQSNVEADVNAEKIEATFAGVLTEPSGSGGSLQGAVALLRSEREIGTDPWSLEINSESLPLSVISLVRRRFPEIASSIPRNIHGDVTGSVLLMGTTEGATEAEMRGVKIRNLTAAEDGSRVWTNGLAAIDGVLVLRGNRVIGRQLTASTDFASATIDGAFSRSFSLVGDHDNPLRWLEAIDGAASVEMDLAAFDRAMPGILPLRDEARIVAGRAYAEIDSTPAGETRRSQLSIRSEQVQAQSRYGAVAIDPIRLTTTVASDQGRLRAESFQWQSAFGTAVGRGDLQSGNADFQIDFGRLTEMLRPIVRISETTLAGAANGQISWNAAQNKVWRLSGSCNATNLLITMPSGQSLRRSSLQGEIDAEGRWGDQSLSELTRASIKVSGTGLDLRADLIRPIQQPSLSNPVPANVRGQGRIETLAELLAPWVPENVGNLSGGFVLDSRVDVSTQAIRLVGAGIALTQPRLVYGNRLIRQDDVDVDFAGEWMWPRNEARIEKLSLAGNAFSLAIQGTASGQRIDLQADWRARLDRIQGSLEMPLAGRSGAGPRAVGNAGVRQVGFQRQRAASDDWTLSGDCLGTLSIKSRETTLDLELDSSGTNIAIIQPPQASAAYQTVGPIRPPNGIPSQPRIDRAARIVWAEPNLKLGGVLHYQRSSGALIADALQISGDWFSTTLVGRVLWNEVVGEVDLQGPARWKMDEVARRLTSLSGAQVRAEGIQQSPLSIKARRQAEGNVALSVQTNLGWESGEIAGVVFGPASVPVELTETSVNVKPSRIPVGNGNVNLAGQVHYRPGPLWMSLDRGVVAESVRLTPEMTNRWLKYLAPLAADAARIDGTVGAEVDEAYIVFDNPRESRVIGRLTLGGVEMTAGPLANQILSGIDQLKSLAQAFTTQVNSPGNRTLISMPAQTVDFTVDQGVVTHNRLFFEIDRARVVTSGRVAFDGRLNMIAQVPLDPRWLGSDLQNLAGQPVTLPIDGTLSRPSLDSSGVREVIQRLGVQAVQSTAENYLQNQLNRGIEKIFGR